MSKGFTSRDLVRLEKAFKKYLEQLLIEEDSDKNIHEEWLKFLAIIMFGA